MKSMMVIRRTALAATVALLATAGGTGPALAQDAPVYRCPGKPELYTNQLSAREARDKGCRTIEGTPITVIQGPKPRVAAPAAASAGSDANRVSNADQRNRDTERRSILESELRSSEDKLADLKKEYNNGQPERLGDEKNYAKYQQRVADLQASISRKEADVAAIKREISKLLPP